MFDSLSDRLGGVFDKLRGRGALTEADVRAALREVRVALLEADVAFVATGQPAGLHGGHQARHREVGAGVDKGRAAVFHDQVAGIEARPLEPGIDQVDAVAKALDKRQRVNHGVGSCSAMFVLAGFKGF